MTTFPRALRRASCLAIAIATAAHAEDDPQQRKAIQPDILVTAERTPSTIENAPSTTATIDADRIATTVNAVNVEDTLKYLPSLLIRKRHIGDTQSPLATRTTGLGASARSLIYADGALLSALIGNNNGTASPRWGLVSPREIAAVDVLYGPFSAAYPGNSIGAVVNITTRLPEALEATVSAGSNVQQYDQYGTHDTLPAYQFGATIGDRFGPLSLFASADHVTSNGQPLAYVTAALQPATATGGYDDVNRTAMPIRVLGASGIEHQRQDRLKLKAALDVTPGIRLIYVGALFLGDTEARAQTYLTDNATGQPAYTSAFSSGIYTHDERQWSHSLSATGTGDRFDWQVIGTLYDYAHDALRNPTTALPGSLAGGAGTITRLDGTGWTTLDAKAGLRTGAHRIGIGAHYDGFEIASNRYATTDWRRGGEGALNQASRGKTRTAALWAQDELTISPPLTLTLGGRYEWWRAYDGFNFSTSPVLAPIDQPARTATGFSPKASLAYAFAPGWTARGSFGKAYRFPTVGELYQAITTGTVQTVPDPTLRPERALSGELAIEHRDARGSARLSLFAESIRDALISQSAVLVAGSSAAYNYVQNIGRTRVRGVELAVQRDNVVPHVDLSGSVTYADATTRADPAFPAAEGRLLPGVPHWKATLVGTWRPADGISLTAAGRYASRFYGTLDNSDVVGNTYQGFYRYLVLDLRAQFRVGDHYELGLGIDNVGNDRYFLFHPFPQRSFQADVTWKL